MSFWKNAKRHLWILGVLAGVLFLALGAFSDQFTAVWNKAVMICLECIGIG